MAMGVRAADSYLELDPLPNPVNLDVSNAPSTQCVSLYDHAASRGRVPP